VLLMQVHTPQQLLLAVPWPLAAANAAAAAVVAGVVLLPQGLQLLLLVEALLLLLLLGRVARGPLCPLLLPGRA
jgi:hypothetical protein